MRNLKYVIVILCLTINITFFTSCDKIVPDDATEVNNSDNTSTDNSIDPISKAKEDSLAQVRKDSVAQVEAIKHSKEIEEKLSSQSDSINNINSKIDELENKSEDMIDKSSAYTFMVVEFVLTLLIIGCFYVKLNSRIKKMNSKSHYYEEFEDDITELKVSQMIQKAINDLVAQINWKNKNQDEIVKQIDQRINKLEGQNDACSQPTQQPQPEVPENGVVSKRVDTFYMPRTRTELVFDDNKKKLVKDETTYFKFTIKKEGKAEFTFDPLESNIIGAYDDRENSLATVCEIESKSTTPTKYKIIAPGEAELRGNIWRVTRKLKLEYV